MSMLRRKKKTIHFIRHAESEHNIPPYDVRLKDPYLTAAGRSQAQCLGQQFPFDLDEIDMVVCSPMKRTIQTALLAFGEHMRSRGKQIIALPELQELSSMPCDTGSHLAELLTEFRMDPVDLDRVTMDWDSKDRQWAPTEQRTLVRMAKARAWLASRKAQNIIVIGHAHCMQLLLREGEDDWPSDGIEEIKLGLLPQWYNCEWRTFVAEEDPTNVIDFEETRASIKSRIKERNRPRVEDPAKAGDDLKDTSPESGSITSRFSFRTSRTNSSQSDTLSVLPGGSSRKGSDPSNKRASKFLSAFSLQK